MTAREISSVLAVAGNADAPATFEDHPDEKEAERELLAFETGMDKLRAMLAQKKSGT